MSAHDYVVPAAPAESGHGGGIQLHAVSGEERQGVCHRRNHRFFRWASGVDDLTPQVTLNERTPYFIQLMDHYSTFAVHRPTIEKFGKATDRYTP